MVVSIDGRWRPSTSGSAVVVDRRPRFVRARVLLAQPEEPREHPAPRAEHPAPRPADRVDAVTPARARERHLDDEAALQRAHVLLDVDAEAEVDERAGWPRRRAQRAERPEVPEAAPEERREKTKRVVNRLVDKLEKRRDRDRREPGQAMLSRGQVTRPRWRRQRHPSHQPRRPCWHPLLPASGSRRLHRIPPGAAHPAGLAGSCRQRPSR